MMTMKMIIQKHYYWITILHCCIVCIRNKRPYSWMLMLSIKPSSHFGSSMHNLKIALTKVVTCIIIKLYQKIVFFITLQT